MGLVLGWQAGPACGAGVEEQDGCEDEDCEWGPMGEIELVVGCCSSKTGGTGWTWSCCCGVATGAGGCGMGSGREEGKECCGVGGACCLGVGGPAGAARAASAGILTLDAWLLWLLSAVLMSAVFMSAVLMPAAHVPAASGAGLLVAGWGGGTGPGGTPLPTECS